MLYPSIQELLKATEKNGEERLNKYSVVMATAKCARMITNDYVEQRHIAEKKIANKETEKDIASLVNKEYRDEKAVKNALREMKEGRFEVYLPGEEGYEESVVVVEDYVEPKDEERAYKPMAKEKIFEEIKETEDFDSKTLMGADEVFDNDTGFAISEEETKID